MSKEINKKNNLYILCSLNGIEREDYIEYSENMLKIFTHNYYKEYIDHAKIELERLKNKEFDSINELISPKSIFYDLENYHKDKLYKKYLKDLILNKIPKLSKNKALKEIDNTLNIMKVIFYNRSKTENILIEIPKDIVFKELNVFYKNNGFYDYYDKSKKVSKDNFLDDKRISRSILYMINRHYIYNDDSNIGINAFFISDDLNEISSKYNSVNYNITRNGCGSVHNSYFYTYRTIEDCFSKINSKRFLFKKLFNTKNELKTYFIDNLLEQLKNLLDESSEYVDGYNPNIFKLEPEIKYDNVYDYIDKVLTNKIKEHS